MSGQITGGWGGLKQSEDAAVLGLNVIIKKWQMTAKQWQQAMYPMRNKSEIVKNFDNESTFN